jgi:alpha/beta hydrolase family protein
LFDQSAILGANALPPPPQNAPALDPNAVPNTLFAPNSAMQPAGGSVDAGRGIRPDRRARSVREVRYGAPPASVAHRLNPLFSKPLVRLIHNARSSLHLDRCGLVIRNRSRHDEQRRQYLHGGGSSMNLVFASGFLVPQRLLGIDYFRGLQDHIAAAGVHAALFPRVPAAGTSKVRAQALADAIQQKFPVGEVHIIAHSMGGLDSRTLIAGNLHELSDPGRIKSLTTVSTPHRGSPVADLLAGPKPGDHRRLAYDMISHAIGLLGVDTGALANLTTQAASRVPDAAQSHPHIRYRSYFASGRPGRLPTCLALLPTHHHIHAVTGQENDGVVALDSAKYGEFQQPFWQCDHVDMIGHNLDTADLGLFQFDHFAAFDAIISQL